MNVQRTCIKVTLFGSHGAVVKDKNLHQFSLPSTKGLHPFSLLVLLLPLVTTIARHRTSRKASLHYSRVILGQVYRSMMNDGMPIIS